MMTNIIKCKHCGKEIEISEALFHRIKEEVLIEEQNKHKKELEEVSKNTEQTITQKLQKDFEFKFQTLEKEKEEEKERNKNLLKQLVDLTEELKSLRRRDEERELEMKQKLLKEEEKIKEETRKKVIEENELKGKEKDKKLHDALKQIEELKAGIQRGSEQAQGEVSELELENLLRKEFSNDQIGEIKKGQKGADIIQKVIDKKGNECGTILWESKNAQWNNTWIQKLKEDQRSSKSHLAVLVSENFPNTIKNTTFISGIWLTHRKYVILLATTLRFNLINLHYQKIMNVSKDQKLETIYQYITGTEFIYRIESIVESFTRLQNDIEREKRWFSTKWANQEKEIRKVIDNTHGMYGDFQTLTGRNLKQLKSSLDDEDENNE